MKPLDDRVPLDTKSLVALRESRGLTPSQMAGAFGGAENTYRAIEAGERDPKLSQVLAILKILGLRIEDLPKLLRKEWRF